jgi:hypothetical protein
VAELRATRVRPGWWPHFSSTLRSTAVTARLGRVLGIAIALCFGTGLISELQYHPLAWLPWPAAPVSIYRVTQGVHVLTGTACIPLVLVKLWSVYPNLWRFPPLRSVRHALERGSVALLVAATLVQLVTGYFNALDWYPFRWYFVTTHHYLAYVVMGSVLLHVAVKLPDIVYGLRADVARADVLSEVPWDENPESHSIAGDRPAPVTPGVSRRGVLVATGVGIGAVVVTAAGQSLTPLEPVGLLAIRQWNRGPQDVPVNRTAEQAEVVDLANAAGWVLQVDGAAPFRLTLDDLEPAATHEARFPISCVEGWSVGAAWRGISLLDLVRRAGGDEASSVQVFSFEPVGAYNQSVITGPQLGAALLATHLNGQRLDLDHGFPLRLIAPNRAGVLNTKWLSRVVVS